MQHTTADTLTAEEIVEHFPIADGARYAAHDYQVCEVCDSYSPLDFPVHTNTSILEHHGIALDGIEHLDLEVPIITGNQRQGDVYLLKVTRDHTKNAKPITKAGVVVVRAETNTANTHTLHTLSDAGGDCLWQANPQADAEDELVQGWLTVPTGSEATLIHTEEHNVLGIGAGTYEIRRQREFAGEWQRVAD